MIKLNDAKPIDGEIFYGFYIIAHIIFYIFWPFRILSLIPLILFITIALILIAFRVGLEINDDMNNKPRNIKPLRYIFLAIAQIGFLFVTLLPAMFLYLRHWKCI